jgi:hypothetical protein
MDGMIGRRARLYECERGGLALAVEVYGGVD